MQLSDPVTTLPQISTKYADLLAKLNITTIRDLITHFPRYHKDTSEVTQITQITTEGEYTIQVYVKSIKSIRIRGGRTMQKALLTDETGNISATWFNQPYLAKALHAEQEYLFVGKVKLTGNRAEYYPSSFEQIIPDRELVHLGRISPQYPLTQGISIKWLRNRIKYITDQLETLEGLTDELDQLQKQYTNIKVEEAIRLIHFPSNETDIENSKQKLSLLELTDLQLKLLAERTKKGEKQGYAFHTDQEYINRYIAGLPFSLTPDQFHATEEIIADLSQEKPMNRLLQGDVGSGKTIVAVIAALAAKLANFQTVILTPTTVLAEQHYQTFTNFLQDSDITIALVTGNTKDNESADVLIGTSAVLARKNKLITNLGLVIVDEQHRFGVGQREELLAPLLQKTKKQPHFLNMTATPIPRTMVLALFGDIQISNIFTKPSGRLPIKTHLVPETKRQDSYDWIAAEVAKGEQVFWMCPLVEESEKLEVKSTTEIYKALSTEIFPELRIGLLHGQMKPTEKEQVMQEFKAGTVDILVTTSVIEVGIDVPNASVMVIEGAERFGMAQLHQIRGRVGRGNKQSWCFLFTTEPEIPAIQRLKFFAEHTDGLEIAEFDLQSRGPGEVYGQRQSGIPNLKIANILDLQLVQTSRQVAEELWGLGCKGISLFRGPGSGGRGNLVTK